MPTMCCEFYLITFISMNSLLLLHFSLFNIADIIFLKTLFSQFFCNLFEAHLSLFLLLSVSLNSLLKVQNSQIS